jgi:hypothetical protein
VRGRLGDLAPVSVEPALSREEVGPCNEYIERYHPLGRKQTFGMRYANTTRAGRLHGLKTGICPLFRCVPYFDALFRKPGSVPYFAAPYFAHDRKALRIAAREGIAAVTTPKLMEAWAVSGGPGPGEVAAAFRPIEQRARFVPGANHPLWVWWRDAARPHGGEGEGP